MKYFFLVSQKEGHRPELLYSCKDRKNIFELVLKYYADHNIKGIVDEASFDPWSLEEGSYLVSQNKMNNDFMVYSIKNTGWVRNYMECESLARIVLTEHELTNRPTDSDDKTIVMSELRAKYKSQEVSV